MEQEAIICSVFLLLLLVFVWRALVPGLGLYNVSIVAIDDVCLSLWVMVEKLRSTQRTHRRAWAFPRPQVASHPFNTV